MGIFDRKPNVEKLAAKKDVEGLIEALQHKDSGVRRAATEALERIVEQLTQVLKDRSIIESTLRVSPREEAAIKLGKIGDRRAIQPLLDVFISESESAMLRTLTLEALGNIGGEEVRQGLINAFKKGNNKLREGILQFLEKDKLEKTGLSRNALYGIIGISEEELSLMDKAEEYYKEGSTYWNNAQWEEALAKWKEAARLNPCHPRVHSALGQVHVELGNIQEAEIEFRKQIEVNPDEFYSHAILSIIYRAGGMVTEAFEEERRAMNTSDYRNNPVFITKDYADKIQTLVSRAGLISDLIQALRDEDKDVRWKAAASLGDIGDARAVGPLVQALKDNDEYVQSVAAGALGRIRDASAVEPLIQVMENYKGGVRCRAARSLGIIGDLRAVEPLIKALRDEDKDVRWNAAASLGDIGDVKALKPLIQALKDEDEDVRNDAVRALGKIKDVSVMDLIIEAFKHDLSPKVRLAAAWSLGEIADLKAVEPLTQALRDEDKDVRRVVAYSLGKIGDIRAVKPLIQALKDGDKDVREAAEYALEEIRAKKS